MIWYHSWDFCWGIFGQIMDQRVIYNSLKSLLAGDHFLAQHWSSQQNDGKGSKWWSALEARAYYVYSDRSAWLMMKIKSKKKKQHKGMTRIKELKEAERERAERAERADKYYRDAGTLFIPGQRLAETVASCSANESSCTSPQASGWHCKKPCDH